MKKDILIIFTVIILVAVLLMGTELQSVDDYYLTHIDDITPQSKTVTLTIDCRDILNNYDKLTPSLKSEKYVPKDGYILKKQKYVLRDGDTAFDVLYRVVRYKKIQFEYQGAEDNPFGSVYVKGINYIYEFSCGESSGWVYKVNGTSPNYGCSKYQLSDGDNLEWIFTCDLNNSYKYSDDKDGDDK